ncbi:tryptophan synthase subunit alpha [Insolitispirillum peregrinum]|uniref:tryptophan synthase subunit alpha n=1 Tax=Insolitispirillum peregrinum TaxID=80876 RepID=UPI003623182A
MSDVTVMNRLSARFAELKAEKRAGLVVYTMANDPSYEDGVALLKSLPAAGVDIIELGMPFSDPMADGPAIQAAGLRALASGGSLDRTLDALRAFREDDKSTPVVLMGYYNPIYSKGVAKFAALASAAGADGLIIVDLPPEEAPELTVHLRDHGLHLILLTAPTTDETRLPTVLEQAGGFLYYVSITGVTGTASANVAVVGQAVARLREKTDLPIAVGFGIKTPAQCAEMAQVADAVVVGSAVVQKLADGLTDDGSAKPGAIDAVVDFVRGLGDAVHAVQK